MYYTLPHFPQISSIISMCNISRVENSVDPDQLASQKPADLDPHCFQNIKFSI